MNEISMEALSLEDINKIENDNFLKSMEAIKKMPEYDFYGRINGLYQCLNEHGPEKYLVRVMMAKIAGVYFHISLLNLFRGHYVESLAALRNSIELATYVNVIHKDNLLDFVFLKKDEDVKEFERMFKMNKFPDNDELVFPLKERWKFVSNWASHMNYGAIHQKIRIESKGESQTLRVGYFDLETEDDPKNFRRHLNYILDTHIIILQVFAPALAEVLDDEFNERLFKLVEDYMSFKGNVFGKEFLGDK